MLCSLQKGVTAMDCPYCKEEMETGKVCSNSGLWWSCKGEKLTLNDEPKMTGAINGYRITAYRCKKCGKIIILTGGNHE